MSEKQKEKVTPEEYLESVSGHAGRCYPAATIVHYKNALQAVALARKEGEERIREILEKIEAKTSLEIPLYSRVRIREIFKSYLPEKGDNNDKA